MLRAKVETDKMQVELTIPKPQDYDLFEMALLLIKDKETRTV